MKLFAYACLAGSGSAQSGDYDDRGISSDYYDSVGVGASDYYEYDEFGNKKKKNKNQWFDNGQKFGLETYTAANTELRPNTNYWDWATALNCWPANIEADQIVYANQLTANEGGRLESNMASASRAVGTDLFPTQQHHNRGPQHVLGSYEILDRAHEASNTAPEDSDLTNSSLPSGAGAATGNRESNYKDTNHAKNGYFAGHGERSGLTDNLNLHQEDPVLRSGLGGLYQYGHDTWDDKTHNEDMDNLQVKGYLYTPTTDATPSHWTHYKQARHAGCLYEKSEWHYGYGTYEQIFLATYYQGYGGFNLQTATDWVAAYDTDNDAPEYVNPYLTDDKQGTNEVEPIWWHFFNAHILPNPQNANCKTGDARSTFAANYQANHLGIIDPGVTTPVSYACPTVPVGTLDPSADTGFTDPETSHAIPLVMANPAYEGLGYLNFIVEYKNADRDVGEDYLEFIDSTPAMDGANYYDGSTSGAGTNGFRNKNTYREINNCNANDNSSNFNDGSNSMAAEQECTGWGENLGNWSGVHGMFYYDLYMGSWLVYPAVSTTNAATPEHYRTWVSYPFAADGETVYFDPSNYASNFVGIITEWDMARYDPHAAGQVKWSEDHDLVVSSFPHNNLGKDFRFNLRVLQGALASALGAATDPETQSKSTGFFTATKIGVNQVYRSYYFYKINQIDIRFPYYVAYALHHENRGRSGAADLGTTLSRTSDGDPASGATADWSAATTDQWSAGTGSPTAATPATEWCDNDSQCAAAGQQWWNTLNNDIVHPLTYDRDPTDVNAELFKHMDTTSLLAYNKNGIHANLDDYQFMHVSMAHTRSNIIPPVDLGTHSPGVNKHNNTNNGGGEIEFHRIMGFIRKTDLAASNAGLVGSTATTQSFNSADWCDTTGGHSDGAGTIQGTMGQNVLERTCGIDFRIVGLMNTYDERRGQRGTYQEIWVQLQYALGRGGRDGVFSSCGLNDRNEAGASNARTDCATNHPIQSPHPYLHFMASEIIKIDATCNTLNVNNPNRCSQMRIGPGESNNAAYGGK